jgi:tRNA/tmRNA/rRNA uracil-C5-methylase (TrmA/RlmC/RlmD family)
MKLKGIPGELSGEGAYKRGQSMEALNDTKHSITLGFAPTCTCNAGTRPGTVLDPFMGAGTTAVVSAKHGRNWIGIELNPEYIEIADARIKKHTQQLRMF